MKKRILIFCLVSALIILSLCACKKAKNEEPKIVEDNIVNAVDFSEYTVDDIFAWAIENDVLSKLSFTFDVADGKTPGSVIGQSVKLGEPIKDKLVITLAEKISLAAPVPETPIVPETPRNAVKVPDVLGLDFNAARSKILAAGLDFDSKYENSRIEKDRVILMDPLPGSLAPGKSTVMLTLSSGRLSIDVKTMPIDLDFSKLGDINKDIKVYVDGELDRSKNTFVNASVMHKVFNFSGSGKVNVRFKINNEVFKTYEIDFEKQTVNLLE